MPRPVAPVKIKIRLAGSPGPTYLARGGSGARRTVLETGPAAAVSAAGRAPKRSPCHRDGDAIGEVRSPARQYWGAGRQVDIPPRADDRRPGGRRNAHRRPAARRRRAAHRWPPCARWARRSRDGADAVRVHGRRRRRVRGARRRARPGQFGHRRTAADRRWSPTQPLTAQFTGDASLRARPMARVTAPLARMGAQFVARAGGRLPLHRHRRARMPLPIDYERAGAVGPGEVGGAARRPQRAGRDHGDRARRRRATIPS